MFKSFNKTFQAPKRNMTIFQTVVVLDVNMHLHRFNSSKKTLYTLQIPSYATYHLVDDDVHPSYNLNLYKDNTLKNVIQSTTHVYRG